MKTLIWEAVYICQGQSDYEPEGRYRHEVAFDGQNIYVLGGGTSEDAFGFSEIPLFNVEKKIWYLQKTFRDHSSKYVQRSNKCVICEKFRISIMDKPY